MGLQICQDPAVKKLREIFGANILRVPEERFQPLSVILRTNGENHWWGDMATMVDGYLMDAQQLIANSRMSDVSNQASRSVNLDLGIKIMDGFLKGFQLPSSSIMQHFKGAKSISFSFRNVNRTYIAPSDLDQLLISIPLDQSLGATQQALSGKAQLFVIDSIITSTDFSIHIDQVAEADFKLDIPAIQQLTSSANAKVKIKNISSTEITFEGDKALTFAFSCLRCKVDGEARINLIPQSLPKKVFGVKEIDINWNHELLTETPELLEWQ